MNIAKGNLRLTDLDVDCLLHICEYLLEPDLINLSRAHWYLQNLIEQNIFYVRSLDLLMCGHRNSPHIEERTQLPLSYANRLIIARNWQLGRYVEHEYFHHSKMFATKLHLERDSLYISYTCYLRQYRRLRNEALQRRFHNEIASKTKTDIADFVKKRDTLFGGRICGSSFILEDNELSEQRLHTPKEYLNCVDFSGDIFVSGSDRCGKLWRRAIEFGQTHLDLIRELPYALKAVQLSDSGDRLFAGLYTDVCRHALREINVEYGMETIMNSNTISIYDLLRKDEHVLFTANFDTTFRMHDRRTNRDECIWEDPFDSSFYCLEYDGLYAVLAGTKYHSRVNLYDIRVPHKYMQLYFPCLRKQHSSSPVYSIACDSRYLFVATDHNLRVLDFKAEYAASRDYRHLFSKVYRV